MDYYNFLCNKRNKKYSPIDHLSNYYQRMQRNTAIYVCFRLGDELLEVGGELVTGRPLEAVGAVLGVIQPGVPTTFVVKRNVYPSKQVQHRLCPAANVCLIRKSGCQSLFILESNCDKTNTNGMMQHDTIHYLYSMQYVTQCIFPSHRNYHIKYYPYPDPWNNNIYQYTITCPGHISHNRAPPRHNMSLHSIHIPLSSNCQFLYSMLT